ncbi:alginate O-acetyltransferase [Endozoicomonas sp. OPT23]|uniref:sensor histidine kinase n=1 Tax=Endozoicomonas sp. OPT23 TaxID=2072845 RepID=UPI00129B33A7|nr:histidine kinase [Endozoicomonas sp. OPT23]MRI31596.1 alginate O-acetyltransferase [Endozoicomonas sp. OPT23]
MPVNATDNPEDDGFFLPDLCSPKAVFMLVLISELFVLIQVLALPGPHHIDWNRLAMTSMFVQWISLVSGAVLCRLRPVLKTKSLPAIVISCLLLVMAITEIFTALAQWFLYRDAFIPTFPDWQQMFRHALVALIITAMLLRYFYIQQEARTEQKASHTARFDALQARIRPHFLFNSMNIIASLIHIDPDKAEETVEDLADLFRSSLQEHGNRIPITKEIDLCQRYLRIEKHRLGDRLQSKWVSKGLPDDLTIPPLTLQPIIENAVYHGIQPLEKGGTVSVDITRINDNIHIRVRNPVQNPSAKQDMFVPAEHVQGNQVALKNIRSRLNMLFGQQASVQARMHDSGHDSEFETLIIYPYGGEKNEHTDHR